MTVYCTLQIFSSWQIVTSVTWMPTLSHIPQGLCWRIKATLSAVITGYTSLPTNYSAIFWLVCHCKQSQGGSGWTTTRDTLRVETKLTQKITIAPFSHEEQNSGISNITVTNLLLRSSIKLLMIIIIIIVFSSRDAGGVQISIVWRPSLLLVSDRYCEMGSILFFIL